MFTYTSLALASEISQKLNFSYCIIINLVKITITHCFYFSCKCHNWSREPWQISYFALRGSVFLLNFTVRSGFGQTTKCILEAQWQMVVWLSKTIDNSIVQLQLSNASAPDDGIYWCGPVSGNKSQGVNISVTVAGNNLVYFHFDVLNYSESGSLLMRWVITLETCESKFYKSNWKHLSVFFVFKHSSFNRKLYTDHN